MTGHLYIGHGESRVIFFRENPFDISLFYDSPGVSIVSWLCLFSTSVTLVKQHGVLKNQIENLRSVKSIKNLLNFSGISNQLKTLRGRFNTFTAKYKELKSELNIRIATL